jgi:hypothetical protein
MGLDGRGEPVHRGEESTPLKPANKSRKRIAWTGFVVLGSTAAAISLALPPSGAASAMASKGAALLKTCISAMSHEKSVHWVSTTHTVDQTTHEPVTVTISSDAGQSSGSQSIVFEEGSESGTERIELVNRTAYVYAGIFVLEKFNGMTAAEAKHFAKLWIKIASSSSAFAATAAGLTVSSLASEIDIPSPTLFGGEVTVFGRATEALESTATTDGVQQKVELYVQARGAPLPVEEITTTSSGHSTMSFSSWGERLKISTPRNTVPLL